VQCRVYGDLNLRHESALTVQLWCLSPGKRAALTAQLSCLSPGKRAALTVQLSCLSPGKRAALPLAALRKPPPNAR
jgi:hypothetical protein